MGFFDRKRRQVREDAEAGELSPGAADVLDAIGAHLDLVTSVNHHITQHFGEPAFVLRDSDRAEFIDLHVMPPAEDGAHATVITSGMSRRPMHGAPAESARAEVLIGLPPTWPLDPDTIKDPQHWWPLQLLANIANLPRAQNIWLGVGDAIPHGRPYSDTTSLCGALLLRPFFAPPGFSTLQTSEHTVNFYGLFLLHTDELQYRQDHTTDEFFALLAEGGVTEILNPTRPSAA
jgi:hypothetical protein